MRACIQLACLLAILVGPARSTLAQSTQPTPEFTAIGRHLSLDESWRFHLGELSNGQEAALDDGSWRELNLPHDWSIEGDVNQSNPTGAMGGFLPAGIGWYRKHLRLPGADQGKRILIDFDGIYMNSTVYVNGQQIGAWVNGYTSFQVDLTAQFKFGQDNVLAVHVDSSKQPYGRWYSGAGIDRHVWLSIVEPLRIDQWGVYVTMPEVSAESATVRVRTDVRNDSNSAAQAELTSELLDATGKTVATATAQQNAGTAFDQTLHVASPRLWSIAMPALYRLHSTLRRDGAVIDEIDTPVGIRKIEFTADLGFILNGQHVKIQGVCIHHDGGSVGAAVPLGVYRRKLEVLKAMGCNAIRCSHNPPNPEFLDLCDQMGFVVMDEAFDEWVSHKGSRFGYSNYFQDWWQPDLSTMLRRDRNHPSIVLWSIGNEIPDQSSARGTQIATQLAAMCHDMDPTRLVTSACDNVNTEAPSHNTRLDFLAQLDVVGYNYADRWGIRRELQYEPDKILYPQRKFIGTEDSGIGGPRGQYAFTLFGGSANDRAGYAAAMIHGEQVWKFVELHDYVAGNFIWTGIDYLGESGRGSASGAIDSCGFPKDGYYFYQSRWTSKPMIHLLPHWNWAGKEGAIIPVIAYTNCSVVELFLNGKSMGAKALEFPRAGNSGAWNRYALPQINPTTTDFHLSWDVAYAPGELKAVGYDRTGKQLCTETVKTAGAPAVIDLRADQINLKADGEDVANVEVRIKDADGNVVPTAGNALTFELSGPATLIGTDNGNMRDTTNFKSKTRSAFNGLALAIVQSTRGAGDLRLTVHSPNLPDARIELHSGQTAAANTLP